MTPQAKPWEKNWETASPATVPWDKQWGGEQPKPAKQTRRGLREQSTLAERMSATAGYPILPQSDLSTLERADLGMSDTFEERASKFKAQHPGGIYEAIETKQGPREVYRRSPDEPARMVDTPGFDWKDLVDSPRDVATMGAQAGIAALGPPGLMAQLLMQGGASGLMHLGKEGIEALRGHQMQSMPDVLKEAGIQAGADVAMGGIPAGVARLARGPQGTLNNLIVNDYNLINELRNIKSDMPGAMAHQINPENLILGRLAAQSSSTSKAFKRALTEQQMAFSDLIGEMTDQSLGQAGRTLTTYGHRAMTKAKNALMRDFRINNEEAGRVIKGIFDRGDKKGFYWKSRQQINDAYAKAGDLGENVTFDLSGAQAAARDVTASVDAKVTETIDNQILNMRGKPLSTEVESFIDVKAPLGDTVAKTARLLETIDPQQMDWRVIKELRTRVGEAITDNPAAEDHVVGAARKIYGELTQAMENPVGGSKQFVNAWKTANALARKRFQVYEQGRVIRTLSEDSPSNVAKMFTEDKDQLTPVIREVIDQYAPERRDAIRKAIQTRILEEPNSVKTIHGWQADMGGNRNAYEWLFKNKTERMKFMDAADAMDQLRASPVERFLDYSTSQIDTGRKLLENVGPAELEQMLRIYGRNNKKAVEAMRMAALDDVIRKHLKFTDEGLPTVNGRDLAAEIKRLQDRGIWQKLLTKEDRIRLRGLDAYARRLLRPLTDTGTSLEQAQAIAALKHPSTFLQGVHALAINNRVIAPLMMSKKTAALFKPKTPKRGPSRKDAWFIAAGMFTRDLAQLSQEMTTDELQ